MERQRVKSKLEKQLGYDPNNVCKNLFKCYGAEWEWNCFGNYNKCIRYKTGDLTLPVKTYEQWEKDRK